MSRSSKQAWEASSLGSDQYRQTLDDAPDAILMVDASGVVSYVNRRVSEVFGFADADLVVGDGLGEVFEGLVVDGGDAVVGGRTLTPALSRQREREKVRPQRRSSDHTNSMPAATRSN